MLLHSDMCSVYLLRLRCALFPVRTAGGTGAVKHGFSRIDGNLVGLGEMAVKVRQFCTVDVHYTAALFAFHGEEHVVLFGKVAIACGGYAINRDPGDGFLGFQTIQRTVNGSQADFSILLFQFFGKLLNGDISVCLFSDAFKDALALSGFVGFSGIHGNGPVSLNLKTFFILCAEKGFVKENEIVFQISPVLLLYS